MNFKYYIKRFVRNYCIIFAIIVMSLTVLRQIFLPDQYFKAKDIFIYMLCAFISCLPSLILHSSKELSEKQMRMRVIIHFIVIEITVITFAKVTLVITSTQSTIILAIQIAVIYGIVRLLIWTDDKKDAHIINEKLKAMKARSENGLEE